MFLNILDKFSLFSSSNCFFLTMQTTALIAQHRIWGWGKPGVITNMAMAIELINQYQSYLTVKYRLCLQLGVYFRHAC